MFQYFLLDLDPKLIRRLVLACPDQVLVLVYLPERLLLRAVCLVLVLVLVLAVEPEVSIPVLVPAHLAADYPGPADSIHLLVLLVDLLMLG